MAKHTRPEDDMVKKIIAIGIIIGILVCSSCGITEKETVEKAQETRSVLTVSDEKTNDDTHFVAEPFTFLQTDNDESVLLMGSVVTEESIYLLLSIREEERIKEERNKITPQMSIEQANQKYDEIEKLYAREEIYILNHNGDLKELISRDALYGEKSIPIQEICAEADGIYIVSKTYYDEQRGKRGNYIRKMDWQGIVTEDELFVSPDVDNERSNPNYNSFLWDAEGNCYARGEYYDAEKRNQFIDVMDSEGKYLYSVSEGLGNGIHLGEQNEILFIHNQTIYMLTSRNFGTQSSN